MAGVGANGGAALTAAVVDRCSKALVSSSQSRRAPMRPPSQRQGRAVRSASCQGGTPQAPKGAAFACANNVQQYPKDAWIGHADTAQSWAQDISTIWKGHLTQPREQWRRPSPQSAEFQCAGQAKAQPQHPVHADSHMCSASVNHKLLSESKSRFRCLPRYSLYCLKRKNARPKGFGRGTKASPSRRRATPRDTQ